MVWLDVTSSQLADQQPSIGNTLAFLQQDGLVGYEGCTACLTAAVLTSLTGHKGIHETGAAPDSLTTLHSLHMGFHHDTLVGS